jgi:hypothetical protein
MSNSSIIASYASIISSAYEDYSISIISHLSLLTSNLRANTFVKS